MRTTPTLRRVCSQRPSHNDTEFSPDVCFRHRGDRAHVRTARMFLFAVNGVAALMARNGKSNKNRLRVSRVVDVPLREVSGICLRRSRNGRMFLIAVGDRVAKIAWFSMSRSDGSLIEWHTKSIAKLSGSELPKRDPQIEAVCADGGGRVLLLQETPPRVELINPEAMEAVASID